MFKKIPVREGAFAEGPEGGILLANKCNSCGQVFFPKVTSCLSCFNDELKDIVLSQQGNLYSYSVVHMPASHFKPPYAVGYINMPEGIRIFAPLKMVEGKPFKVGMKMSLVIEELWKEEDTEVVGYKFNPI